MSCWTASDHESHALWKIFCPTEGVVIQTTLDQLRKSVGPLHVRFVNYAPIGNRTPNVNDMVIQKRPMFAYEQEVRVVLVYDHKDEATKPKRETFGSPIGWDPELHVETVRVNPGADHSFIETVTEVTKTYAPALTERVFYSEMATRPE